MTRVVRWAGVGFVLAVLSVAGWTYLSFHQPYKAYDAAEHWARTAVADRAAFPGWPRSLTDVLDAAFHLYARGATDYAP